MLIFNPIPFLLIIYTNPIPVGKIAEKQSVGVYF